MDAARCDRVIQFALLVAGRSDDFVERDLGPIHLLKYVYLADLAYAQSHGGESFTGARWRFYHYGPWAAEVHDRIEPALEAIDATRQSIESTRYDGDFVRWRKTDDELFAKLERELPKEVVFTVRRAVREFGKDTAELLHHVYTTSPMLAARPRSDLVFRASEPRPRYEARPEGTTTAKQQKRRKAQVAKAREEIKARLAARREERAARKLAPPPRYDEVFFEGLAMLDEGASEAGELKGEAEVAEEVWDSETRGEPRD